VAIFRRLLGFLRPYRRGVWASLILAALAMAGTVAIPWLTGRAIDRVRALNTVARGYAFNQGEDHDVLPGL